jgi:hypothetical protein
MPRAWLHQGLITPFDDYAIPALVLGLLCGGSALSALAATLTNAPAGALGSLVAGVLIIGFELVEIAVVGFTPVLYPTLVPAWLQVFYLALGSMLVILAVRLWRATAPTDAHPALPSSS